MTADVTLEPAFEAGVASPLFQTRPRESIAYADLFCYDVSPDWRRFLIDAKVSETAPPPIEVLDWRADLKR